MLNPALSSCFCQGQTAPGGPWNPASKDAFAITSPLGCPSYRKGGGPIRGFVVSLLAVGLWLVVIAAVAWMVHSTPDSNRSIQRFRKARRSLAPQGRRHRAVSPSTSETSTVVVMETPRRGRANRVIDLRERDPEPRPARWPADGWSLGSVAPSGPRIAWATSGALAAMRTTGPVESSQAPERAPYRDVARPGRPDVPRGARPAARTSPRTTSQLPPLPQWDSPRTQPRTTSPRPQMASAPRTAARQASPGRPVRQPAAGHLPAQPVQRPVAREQVRRPSLDERPSRAGVGQTRRAADPKGSARWRVVDLTPEPRQRPIPVPAPVRITGGRSEIKEIKERQETEARRWALAAGAESQGAPGPLPAVFRLDPLHARNEAGSRAR